ncbi:hypothetical protein [Spirochaeta cellobiosiphila]|nr:hypothetical protein [Spirochaeta cellobiosiphila]
MNYKNKIAIVTGGEPDVRGNCIVPGAVETRWWAGDEDKMEMLAG